MTRCGSRFPMPSSTTSSIGPAAIHTSPVSCARCSASSSDVRVLLAPGAVALSVQNHAQILDGFQRRNADATVAAMESHLTRIHQTTLAVMDE